MTLLSRRPGVLGTALDLLLVHGPAVLLCACCLLTLGSLACACLCWCWRRCCSCLPSLSGLGLKSLGLSSLGLGLSSVGLACGARALASVSVRLLLPRLAWRMACLCSLGRFQHMVCLHTRGGLPQPCLTACVRILSCQGRRRSSAPRFPPNHAPAALADPTAAISIIYTLARSQNQAAWSGFACVH